MKKVIILIALIVLLTGCKYDEPAILEYNVEELKDHDYSIEYLYYNISYEDVTFNSINELSSVLLLININVDDAPRTCIWKDASFTVVDIIYGEYDEEMSVIKYPVEYYDIETNELKDYPDIENGLYLMYLEKNDNNEYRITNNYNGLISVSNLQSYNSDVELKSILTYYVMENAFVNENMIDSMIIPDSYISESLFNNISFTTINGQTYQLPYYYDSILDKRYILYGDIQYVTN